MSHNSSTALGWKDLALIVVLVALFNAVVGQAEKLGPISLWQRYALHAAASTFMFLAIAVFMWLRYRRTEPIQAILLEAIKPAVPFGIVFGAVLLLPWWVLALTFTAAFVAAIVTGGRGANDQSSRE